MRSLFLQFLFIAASALYHDVEGYSLHHAYSELALVQHISLGFEHDSHLDGFVCFCKLVIAAGQCESGWHVVHRNTSILDYSAIYTQLPALLLISDALVLVVQLSPQSLLKLVLDRLVVFDVGDSELSVNLARVQQEEG